VVIPVTEKGFKTLTLCNGTRGIGEIEEIVEPEAMEFLISLYMRRFLELLPSSTGCRQGAE